MIHSSRPLYSDAVTDYMTGYVDHHIIGSADGAQTNYQVQIRVYRGYGSNTGSSVFISPSEIRSDFNDIRFVDGNGRILPCWIETTGTNYADFWVMLYSISTGGAIVRILYGGNVPAVSNAPATFQLYDDFLGSALDTTLWTLTSGNLTIGSSLATLAYTGSVDGLLNSNTSFGYGYAAIFGNTTLRRYNRAGNDYVNIHFGTTTGLFFYGNYPNKNSYGADINDGTWRAFDIGAGYDGSHRYEILRASNSSIWKIDGATVRTDTTYIPTGNLQIGAYCGADVTAGISIDWIAVRKYTLNEPVHGWWGIAEDL